MLLQCVTCGKDVSSEAKKCPHCGELKFGGYSEFHLFSIQGRVGRMRYFAYSLTYSIINLLLLAGFVEIDKKLHAGGGIALVGLAIMAVPVIILMIQRCHDCDTSGWYVLCSLVPLLNAVFAIALFFIPGTNGANRFGLPSK